ncbi:Endoplasmic reticulum membrane sensor NFE2L1 [Frankliniella fusca]|uniref:Endoplasmic reticulum membrane sensor NFE2L1 n=1 Tax=Frankliniella fusca TaxID=407009 RepID=A0AAE1HLX5_9NEOP|nr:Endoplasmic reticulum membrane sensor NFE2L1 [Frankliniella fusca]
MGWYKKVWREELLQLVLILGLLGVDRDLYRRTSDFHPVRIGSDDVGGGVRLEQFNNPLNHRIERLHPKSLDSMLLNYERDLLDDLNALGRYNRIEPLNHNVTAYVLNVNVGSMSLGSESSAGSSEPAEPTSATSSTPGSELTQELLSIQCSNYKMMLSWPCCGVMFWD